MAHNKLPLVSSPWSWYKKFGFRVLFIFLLAMSIPFSGGWYQNAFTVDWLHPHYRDIYDIARFQPAFSSLFSGKGRGQDDIAALNNKNEKQEPGKQSEQQQGQKNNKDKASTDQPKQVNLADPVPAAQQHVKQSAASATDKKEEVAGMPPKRGFLTDYADWGIAFLIGLVGGTIWTLLDRKTQSYPILYYWIRVVVRYRAGIGIIGFGFTKLFPTQMPYPSLGLLNSNFGDFTAQKIYWLSVGIVPWYQVFGGVVEIAAGAMLFFRKTTTFGAILLVGALGDITFVNYAYDGGVHVYAFYFVFLGLFLLADDIPKLYNLLILERYTVPVRFYPDFNQPVLKYSRIALKAFTFVIFFGVLTYTEVINFKYDPYKQPATAGPKQLRGNYHVTEFKVNGQLIPYNPLDSVRWQEATFENWTTLSFKVNHPVLVDPSNGGGSPMKDIQRTFEISGVAGGQRAFHYYADTVDKVLYLQDKNVMTAKRGKRPDAGEHAAPELKEEDNWISKTAWQHIGDEKKMIDPRAWSTRRDREFAKKGPHITRNRMVLHYSTVDGSQVILSGINERKDSIYVVLERYKRPYALQPGTLNAGKY